MEGPEIRAREILKRLREGPIRGAEIGVAVGQTSEALLRLRPNLELLMIDSYASKDEQPEHYKQSGDWHAHCTREEQEAHMRVALDVTAFADGRRLLLKLRSVEASKMVEDHSIDFAFIDADHSYEGAREDISAWVSKVRHGGYLCGHDYGHIPETEKPWTTGPKKAVDEFILATGFTLELGENYTWFVRL
jgi:methyltransferase family protein